MIFGAYGYHADSKTFIIEIANSPMKDGDQLTPPMTQANAIPHLYNAIKKHMTTDDVDVWQVVVKTPNVGLLKVVAIGVVQYMHGLGLENIKTVGC